ncbi:hypothetical protein CfE428DRAFT_6635 [Chthoniobacter flavus Ellin428]|uniref:Uncharacterized protein n=1 Tax=Chthoniobacter flavus Ellin428 TaxID=497964 RepID=B4DCJ4_9BACT|nr:hypothetical protein CfE428DRAFT_6635 [Chthoniobacter flavus Ellin428]TCO87718.1 hypothetical protein EV701_12017 [Chthoniobacter flavus]
MVLPANHADDSNGSYSIRVIRVIRGHFSFHSLLANFTAAMT